jgi:hypothetical protein
LVDKLGSAEEISHFPLPAWTRPDSNGASMDENLTEALEQLARACRIMEMENHGDMSLGHVSPRDPNGRGFWLKRNRIGLGEV